MIDYMGEKFSVRDYMGEELYMHKLCTGDEMNAGRLKAGTEGILPPTTTCLQVKSVSFE